MTLTMTDMFCGAGGSSTGALAVPGIEVRTAMNSHGALLGPPHQQVQKAIHPVRGGEGWSLSYADLVWPRTLIFTSYRPPASFARTSAPQRTNGTRSTP